LRAGVLRSEIRVATDLRGRIFKRRTVMSRRNGSAGLAPLSGATLILLLILSVCTGVQSSCSPAGDTVPERPLPDSVSRLVLYPRGAVAFESRPIPADTLRAVLAAVTPYSSLSAWKVVAVAEATNRIRLLESMQEGFRQIGRDSWASTMERWKRAPVLLAFVLPKTVEEFGGVPPAIVRPLATLELGMGVQSLVLVARTYGLETHWIAGANLIADAIERELGIPEDYGLAFFGMVGFPAEEIPEEYPSLESVAYGEGWGEELSF
jgi:nitroreductase